MNVNIKNVVLILIVVMMASFLMAGVLGGTTLFHGIDIRWNNDLNASLEPFDETREFAAEEITELDAATISSDVNIIVTEEDTIKVHLYGEVTPDVLPAEFARQNGSRLTVSARPRSGINISSRIRLTLDIYLPADQITALKAETVSGNLNVPGLDLNKLDVHTVSGNLYAVDLDLETLMFKSVSGRLRADNVFAERANLNTTSGSLEITGFGGDIIAKTVSGDLIVDYSNFDNDITFDTTSGKTRLTLPEDSQFSLRLNTVSGKVTSGDFPLTVTSSSPRSFEGSVGNSANRIFVNSVSGGITISSKQERR